MPTSAEPDLLCDTSVAVALLLADHEAHERTAAALGDKRLGLAGHAAFETVSVLTRLPGTHRITAELAVRLVRASFPGTRHLSAAASRRLLDMVGRGQLVGGSVYDALVAAAAVEHHLPLASRDRRALRTYEALGAEVDVLP